MVTPRKVLPPLFTNARLVKTPEQMLEKLPDEAPEETRTVLIPFPYSVIGSNGKDFAGGEMMPRNLVWHSEICLCRSKMLAGS